MGRLEGRGHRARTLLPAWFSGPVVPRVESLSLFRMIYGAIGEMRKLDGARRRFEFFERFSANPASIEILLRIGPGLSGERNEDFDTLGFQF